MRKFVYLIVVLVLASCSSKKSIHPERKDMVEAVYASGKIYPKDEVVILAMGSGIIRSKFVSEGDSVQKGQLLFVIGGDAPSDRLSAAGNALEVSRANSSSSSRVFTEAQLQLQNAKTKYELDSVQYYHLKNLWAKNVGSKVTLDNAYAAYLISSNTVKAAQGRLDILRNELSLSLSNAQSAVSIAQSDFDNYRMKAEQSGILYQVFKEVGETVRMGEPLAIIGDKAARSIRLSVDQADIDLIKIGQKVLLKTDVNGKKIFNGKVTKIYPVMKELDQTFRVDAEFADSVNIQFIHSTVEANIIIQEKKNVLILPRSSLLAEDSVLVSENGSPKAIMIKTGIHNLTEIEILEGLTEQSEILLPNQK